MPGGTRSLFFCHLTPQRISRPAACRPSQHVYLSLSRSLFVLWITDVLKNSRFDAVHAQRSWNGTVKSLFCCRKREKQREVDRVGGRGRPVGLPLACSSLLGLPWCWVQSSQLREGACVCSWVCSWHREPLVTSVLQWESEKTGSGACMPSNQMLTLIMTNTVCPLTPKIPLCFTHTAVYVLWVQFLSKRTDEFQLLVFKLAVMTVSQPNTRTKTFLLGAAAG